MNEEISKQQARIALAFEHHFRHFGFKKTTVDDVAEELGVSKKTIYKYFRSKDEIFYFVISQKSRSRRLMIEKEIIDCETAWEKMESMIRINFDEFRKLHKKRVGALDERFQVEIAAAAFRETFVSLVREIIDEGTEKGEFEVCDQEMTVAFIQAIITEAVKIIRADEKAMPEDELVCNIRKMLKKEK